MLWPVGGSVNDPQPRLDSEAIVHLGTGSFANEAGPRPVDAIAATTPGGSAIICGAGCGRRKDGLPPTPSHWTLVGPRKAKAMDATMLIWGVPRDIDARKVGHTLLGETQVDACKWRGQGKNRHVYLTLLTTSQMNGVHRRAVHASRKFKWRVAKGRSWAKERNIERQR